MYNGHMPNLIKGNPEIMHQFRDAMNLSQAEFAVKLGVSTNTVARWERGEIFPPRLAELAAGFVYMMR